MAGGSMPDTLLLEVKDLASSQEMVNMGDKRQQNGAPQETQVLIGQQEPSQPITTKAVPLLRHHPPFCSLRRLAIFSIVCGFSCVGIRALLLALQAEREGDLRSHAVLARRSCRWSVVSIVVFVGGLVCLPFLVILVSYIMTLIE